MDEIEIENESEEQEVKQGSGSLLATARKQQKRTVEEIAEELNLSVSQIRSIELDQKDGLPEPTYVRGYIRSYAKLLGLDPEHILDHYLNPNWQQGSSLEEMPRGIGASEDSSNQFSVVRPALILVMLGLVAYFWWSGAMDRFLGNVQSPTLQSESNELENEVQQDLGTVRPVDVASGLETSDANQALDEMVTGAEPVDPVLAPEAIVETSLSLTFSDTSWIDIRDSDGERLAYKSFVEGDILDIESRKTLNVFIGNASAVQVSLNGEEFDLKPHLEGVFARFVVEGSND